MTSNWKVLNQEVDLGEPTSFEDSPQGVWYNMAERMLLEFAESGCPIFRATTPLSRGRLKSKGHG